MACGFSQNHTFSHLASQGTGTPCDFKTTSSQQSHGLEISISWGGKAQNEAEIQGSRRVRPLVRPSLVLTLGWSGV